MKTRPPLAVRKAFQKNYPKNNDEKRSLDEGHAAQKIKSELLEIFGVNCVSVYTVSKSAGCLFFAQSNFYLLLNFDSKIEPHVLEFIAKMIVAKNCAAHANFPFSKKSNEIPNIRVDDMSVNLLKALAACRPNPKVTLAAGSG